VVPSRAPLLCGATRKAAIALDYRRCFWAGGFPAVEWSELLGIRDPGEPTVASQLANDCAILLFHPGLIILSIRARTRELQPCLPTVAEHRFIDKGAVIVCVEPAQRKR
jgi:hypothetical protein